MSTHARIAQLTSEQAQQAVLRFYEISSEEIWSGAKPSLADIEAWAEEIQHEATPDLRSFLEATLEEQDSAARGRTARALLATLNQHEPLRPYIDRAVADATTPHMVPLPVVIGAVIVVLAAIPSKIEKTDERLVIEFDRLDSVTKFVEAITEFLKTAKPFATGS